MSAIWGAINLHGDKIKKEEITSMKRAFDDCVLDRISEVVEENVYMGCGMQYFTEESKNEVLPITEDPGVFFDADVVLDNREELLHILGLHENTGQIPDGTILYQLLKKDQEKYLNKFLGVYSFVYYDTRSNYLCIAGDALANRTLYYRQVDDTVYFSSLINPLASIQPRANINQRWVADFLALDNLGIGVEIEETLYEEIFKLEPAQIITWSNLVKEKRVYWTPSETIKEERNISDKECKEKFVEIFGQAVKSTLRSSGETAILLSGGLDSTSVACFAARELKKEHKVLNSYTSIPIKEYHSKETILESEDESDAVRKTKEFLGNLNCTFLRLQQNDPWKDRKKYLSHREIPYKSMQNIMWIEEAMEAAYKDGAKIMLNGSYGNVAFSFGNFGIYMNSLLSEGKVVRFFKELSSFQPYFKYSRKSALKRLIKEYFKNKTVEQAGKEVIGNSYITKSLMDKYDCKNRLGQYAYEREKAYKVYKTHRQYLYNTMALSQIGEGYTKASLYTGILQRDPTCDKRLIEFCMSLPVDQYVRDGIERRLVNTYLKEYLPAHISHETPTGVQSADMRYRLQKRWGVLKKEWLDIYAQNLDSEYVDCRKAMVELEQIKSLDVVTDFQILRHMYTLLMLEQLQEIENVTVMLEK